MFARLRRARSAGLGAGAAEPVLERAERAAAVVLGPGLGRERRTRSRWPAISRRGSGCRSLIDADGLNALAGRPRAARAPRTAPTVLTPHAGELGRLLGRESAEVAAHRLAAARGEAARAPARSSCSRATTRSSPPASASRSARPAARGLATAGTGDVLSGDDRRRCSPAGIEPFAAACAGVQAHPGPAATRRERIGAESVIAGDVIEALPGGAVALSAHDPFQRASRRSSTSAPSSATARGWPEQLGDGTELCAVVKADGYGHGARRAPTPRWPAARPGWRSRPRPRRPSCASAARDVPLLMMGALTAAELDVALRRGPTWPSGARIPGRAGRARPACAASGPRPRQATTAAWAGSASATPARVARARRRRGSRRAARAGRRLDPLRDRRRARLRLLRRAARALPRGRGLPISERHPESLVHAANSAAVASRPRARTSTWPAAASRSTGSTRSSATPPSAASSRRSRCTPTSPTSSASPPASSAGYGRTLDGAGATPGSAVLPIGYGDGVRRGLSNNARGAGPRPPLSRSSARSRWTT